MSTRSPRSPGTPRLDLDALVDDPATRIIVCCGAGGVGKTTTAAALALRAAEAGDHATRASLEERGRDALAELERPSYELPLLADAVDLSGLYELAGMLKEQGIA